MNPAVVSRSMLDEPPDGVRLGRRMGMQIGRMHPGVDRAIAGRVIPGRCTARASTAGVAARAITWTSAPWEMSTGTRRCATVPPPIMTTFLPAKRRPTR